jgi:serine dehydrogenase proteinase
MSTGPTPVRLPSLAAPKYAASLYPGKPHEIPSTLVSCVRRLESALQMPIWLIIQSGGDDDFGGLDNATAHAFCSSKSGLPENQHIGLVIDSPGGGDAKRAYQIARYIKKRCGGFTAIVPDYAKSAATLLLLGADKIIIGKNAELGPLDAQVYDSDREQRLSALDEIQALERVNAFALQAVDIIMCYWQRGTKKSFNMLIPEVQNFVATMMRPLFEKVDTVHYIQMSRLLKVAEEYAIRLLQPRYSPDRAKEIARYLVDQYPAHDFFVDLEETEAAGLDSVEEATGEVESAIEDMIKYTKKVTYLGWLEEII